MEGIMIQRIENVLYTVRIKSAENAKESYETKLRKLIEREALNSLNNEDSKKA